MLALIWFNFYSHVGKDEDEWQKTVAILRELEEENQLNSGEDKEKERSKNVVQVVHESDGEVVGIYFQTESQRKLYSKMGTVLEMDGTYDTNNAGFSLYHLLCEDNNGESQPVAQYFTKTETKAALSDFLRIFTEVIKQNNLTLVNQ